MQFVMHYDWPGNVRELESVIQSAIILTTSEMIDCSSLPKRITTPNKIQVTNNGVGNNIFFEQTMRETERTITKNALVKSKNNCTKAANLLQISLRNLQYTMKKHGIGNNNGCDFHFTQ